MDVFKTKFIQEAIEGFIAFFLKWWVVGSYIMMAIVTKFSFDRSRGIRMTFWEVLFQIAVAWLVGAMAAIACVNHHYESQMYWIVPICTLFADKIYLYAYVNRKPIIAYIIKVFKGFPIEPDTQKDEDGQSKKLDT